MNYRDTSVKDHSLTGDSALGCLNLVSIGPGYADHVTPRAAKALAESDVIIGYELYLSWIKPWLVNQEVLSSPLTLERDRARKAIELARAGRRVSLISSGDIGVYAMAALAFEELEENDVFSVRVVPGITAANACASLLGAPLSHDYATLSLSDLLCPWDWIEQRARHIAQADLCAALYNVQSKQRQDGIYKILRIFLIYKEMDTVCGVVRNAYRSDESAYITTLSELLKDQFDMFTTILIGNRNTRRKGQFIYTARGYSGWEQAEIGQGCQNYNDVLHGVSSDFRKQTLETGFGEPSAQVVSSRNMVPMSREVNDSGSRLTDLPKNAIWVFSGTSDGNELAGHIADSGHSVVVSAATEYGAEVARVNCPQVHVISGRIGIDERKQSLENATALAIVDATHPYSVAMSKQLISLSREIGLPYVRFDRSSTFEDGDATICHSTEDAAIQAVSLGKRIFLAIGSKDIKSFLSTPHASNSEWFARVTPDIDSIKQAIEAGIPRSRICAMQGPFSEEFNELLWKEWRIDCVVTKDSGTPGGYEAKIKAAQKLGVSVVVVRRPPIKYPVVASDFSSIIRYLSSPGVQK